MKLAGAYINDDTYERLVALAAANDRTLAGECRHLFDRALRGELQVPDAPAPVATAPLAVNAARPPISPVPAPTQAAANRPPRQTRLLPRTVEARPLPGAEVKVKAQSRPQANVSPGVSHLAAGGGLSPRCTEVSPKAGAAVAVPARRVRINLPVAGEGVVVPTGNGMVCTPKTTPATGSLSPEPFAEGAQAGPGEAAEAATMTPATTARDHSDAR